jgi:hypothetical protein
MPGEATEYREDLRNENWLRLSREKAIASGRWPVPAGSSRPSAMGGAGRTNSLDDSCRSPSTAAPGCCVDLRQER